MKKITMIMLCLVFILVLIVGMTACNDQSGIKTDSNNKSNITDPALKKVEQAFDGVENSMKTTSLESAKTRNIKLMSKHSKEDALAAIFNVYTQGDKQASIPSDALEYDQPPMRQFQYLKAVFEEIGDDYKLGTKYYYDITGQIYFDEETGYRIDSTKANAAQHLYDYVFGFAISIELRENDLIFAEVAFNISLTKGNTNYKTSWYVSFDLDYDYKSNEPTYTLLMYTDNKAGELAFLHREQGYEYDYVEMKNGEIKEWRKFVMETEKEIVLSEKYTSFEDYIEEGIAYEAGTSKWIKDGSYYKLTQMNEAKNRTLAVNFVDGLGMNSTNIKSAAFFNKAGEQNQIIDTYYKKICALYGDDIIYDLVCKHEDDEKEDNNDQWDEQVSSYYSNEIPSFSSQTATFDVQRDEDATTITVSNATAADYDSFKDALEGSGFTPGNEEGTYFKTNGNQTIYVAIIADRNVIFITSGESGENGNENNAKKLEIDYGIAYSSADYQYISYNKTNITAKKDIANSIADLSSGMVSDTELDTLILGDSCIHEIQLDYSSATNTDEESFASSAKKEYGGKYINGDWINRCENTVNYRSITDKDVLVCIGSKGDKSGAYLYVYVLLFDKGTVEGIVDGNGSGENNQGNENGENNQGNENGENNQGNENGEDNGENEGLIVTSITAVGDFNDWDVNNGADFYKTDENRFVLNRFHLYGNTKFKIVVNHTWTINGGYGYDDISNIDAYEKIFSSLGKEKNISAKSECEFNIIADVQNGNIRFSFTEVNAIVNDPGNNQGGQQGTDPDDNKTDDNNPDDDPQTGEYNPGDPDVQVTVYVNILDSHQNVVDDGSKTYTFNNGQTINVSQFITEEGQKVYNGYYFGDSNVVTGTIEAYDGLTLYVWKELPKGTFTIYNVTKDGTTIWSQFEDYVGSGTYFGYSFEYLLYWNEGCTDQIALDHNFNLTEDGITVYRHIYEDFFVLNIVQYINGHPYSTTSNAYRKEKIYRAFGSYGIGIVNDYPTSYFGDDVHFYLGEGTDNELTEGSLIATSENSITVCIYVNSSNHHVYTLKTESGDIVTEDYITTFGEFDEFYYSYNIFSYKNYSAEYCTVSGNTIIMHNISKLKGPLIVYSVYNGRVLYERSEFVDTYFTTDSPFTFIGDVGPSSEFFTDAACTSPIVLEENNGVGEYVVSNAKTLYSPLNTQYIP